MLPSFARGWTAVLVVCWLLGKALGQGLQQSEQHCHYGSLPGRWVPDTETPTDYLLSTPLANISSYFQLTHSRWQVLEEGCQLDNLVLAHVHDHSQAREALVPATGPAGVLLLGDSVDRMLVADVCTLGRSVEVAWQVPGLPSCDYHAFHGCVACQLPGLALAKEALWGTAPAPPYPLAMQGTWRERVPAALAHFEASFGAAPGLVVVSSNFWDIARWHQDQPALLAADTLPDAALHAWLADASALLQFIKGLVPASTVLAWRTNVPPLLANCSQGGQHSRANLGRRAHVTDLNAAGRQVAAAAGYQVVDAEALAAAWGSGGQVLRDQHHPHAFLTLQLLNLYLHLLRQAGHL